MQAQNCMETFERVSDGQSTLPSWTAWLAMGGSKLAREALALVEALADSGERRRQRRSLLSLDERMRKDIGLSSADIWLEASKPSWRK